MRYTLTSQDEGFWGLQLILINPDAWVSMLHPGRRRLGCCYPLPFSRNGIHWPPAPSCLVVHVCYNTWVSADCCNPHCFPGGMLHTHFTGGSNEVQTYMRLTFWLPLSAQLRCSPCFCSGLCYRHPLSCPCTNATKSYPNKLTTHSKAISHYSWSRTTKKNFLFRLASWTYCCTILPLGHVSETR
jgi:hypothetical protein